MSWLSKLWSYDFTEYLKTLIFLGDEDGVAFKQQSSSESSSESEDEERKPKGAEGLIEIENPNRVKPKQKKVTALDTEDGKPQLSRREREELEKQKAKAHYQKLHAAGKTEEARADLARLAISWELSNFYILRPKISLLFKSFSAHM